MSNQIITRNHLLLTDRYAISGMISPIAGRLVDHLRTFSKPCLAIRDARVLTLTTGTIETSDEALLTTKSLVLSHEYVDCGSDQHLRTVHEHYDRVPVRLKLEGFAQSTLRGYIEASGLDWQTPFLVLKSPELELHGPEDEGHRDVLRGLSYVIVNRDRINLLIRG
ncbi:MAG TPA: hypothetical protein PKA37_16570 [Planctomycetota bacterium]|nr:hypothetical protein [Planctomycetota bacterium]